MYILLFEAINCHKHYKASNYLYPQLRVGQIDPNTDSIDTNVGIGIRLIVA